MPGDFIDTNVLIYVASADPRKADRAEQVLGRGGIVSVQVLNEAANVARRKMAMSWPDVRTFLSGLRGLLTVHPLTLEIHETGLALAERHSMSVFDGMIVAAALHAGCDRLWSEDMQDGMIFDGRLRVANPFAGL
jgi:predicted nucleic acid-binding protein